MPVFRLEGVDVHRAIGRLRSHELVERVPGHALHVVIVLSNLPHACSW
jgi:hypothetical protein